MNAMKPGSTVMPLLRQDDVFNTKKDLQPQSHIIYFRKVKFLAGKWLLLLKTFPSNILGTLTRQDILKWLILLQPDNK